MFCTNKATMKMNKISILSVKPFFISFIYIRKGFKIEISYY